MSSAGKRAVKIISSSCDCLFFDRNSIIRVPLVDFPEVSFVWSTANRIIMPFLVNTNKLSLISGILRTLTSSSATSSSNFIVRTPFAPGLVERYPSVIIFRLPSSSNRSLPSLSRSAIRSAVPNRLRFAMPYLDIVRICES